MTLRSLVPVLGLLGAVATGASAQTPSSPGFSLVLRGVDFSACVEFLMDPAAAAKQVGDGYQAIPAGAFGALSPILQREIQGDTVHSRWVPAQLCVMEAPTISAGGTVLTPERKMGNREVIGYWAIAARRAGSGGPATTWYAVHRWTNDWHVERLAKPAYIPIKVFKRALTKVPESTRHRYEIKIGKTVLSWDGELTGRDSTATTATPGADLIFTGMRDIEWNAATTTRPDWTRTLPGLFRVEGKDDLAKALKGSPIRMFGPMYWGGDARMDFTRLGASGGGGTGR
ncbi:MAG TPA: hypothetical protein VFV65_09010 [Gemmatimonadales bacterium]|nr:hypothetical protein [Gemmatimonadales bacterium]